MSPEITSDIAKYVKMCVPTPKRGIVRDLETLRESGDPSSRTWDGAGAAHSGEVGT